MVVAGNETTTKLLGHAAYHLTRHPDQHDLVFGGAGTPSLVAPWVEETLRFDTSSQLLARYLLRDVELHGRVAPQGSKLLLVPGLGQPRRVRVQPPGRSSTSPAIPTSWPRSCPSAAAGTSAWAPTWPGSRPGSR